MRQTPKRGERQKNFGQKMREERRMKNFERSTPNPTSKRNHLSRSHASLFRA
jgi:hypothetical protein